MEEQILTLRRELRMQGRSDVNTSSAATAPIPKSAAAGLGNVSVEKHREPSEEAAPAPIPQSSAAVVGNGNVEKHSGASEAITDESEDCQVGRTQTTGSSLSKCA